MSNKMFDMIFNLKFQAKSLNRQAAKCEKNEKVEKDKAFKAMKKNNMDGAQIHAANAIRLHNENLQFLRIASQCASLRQGPCPVSALHLAILAPRVVTSNATVAETCGCQV